MTVNRIFHEMHSAIRKAADKKKPVPDTRFHKHRLYVHYGLYTSVYRKIMKDFKLKIAKLTLEQRKQLAMKLIQQNIGELGHAGIMVLRLSVDEFTFRDLRYIDGFMNHFCSWSHVDHICGDVVQPLLEMYEKQVIQYCRIWSTSKNRWKRRASIVVFTRRSAVSGMYSDYTIELCERLKWDKEDIVRKGVGWALKDSLRSDKKRFIRYIMKLRREGISSTITLYAIRDLKGNERREILAIKK